MKKHNIFFVVGIALAVFAAIIAFYGYNSIAGMVNVAVAGADINADDPASPKNVVIGKTPRGALQKDTVLRPEDLANMSTKGYIPAGTVLRKSMFVPTKDAGLKARLAQMGNKVAIALASNVYTTVGGEIQKDYKVSINSSLKGQTRQLAAEAIILSVPDDNNNKAVVLAVSTAEADVIMAAISNNEELSLKILPSQEG